MLRAVNPRRARREGCLRSQEESLIFRPIFADEGAEYKFLARLRLLRLVEDFQLCDSLRASALEFMKAWFSRFATRGGMECCLKPSARPYTALTPSWSRSKSI